VYSVSPSQKRLIAYTQYVNRKEMQREKQRNGVAVPLNISTLDEHGSYASRGKG
jgi:hypothetical protein